MSELLIEHDEKRKGFFARLDGSEARLTYSERPDGVLVYESTFVPPAMRGGGVAGKITSFALEWAREEGRKIKPTCPYIVSFLEKHPEFGDVVSGRG
jgi:predicted GNAT family acetyltransferase